MFDNNIIEEQVEQVQEVVEQEQQVRQSDKEENFRNLRERSQRIEREKEEALKMVDYYKQQLEAKSKVVVDEESDDLSMSEGEFAEGKHLNKVAKELRNLKKQIQKSKQEQDEERQRSFIRETEMKLMARYPDAESILTKENMDELARLEPAIANSIKYNPDLYERGVTAITMIKKLGILADPIYKADAELARRNAAKPKSSNSLSPQTGDSPISQANAFQHGLTAELKASLLREMNAAIKLS